VVQWIRICLLMQGTWVQSLVQEDSTCRGATKPVCHNYVFLAVLGLSLVVASVGFSSLQNTCSRRVDSVVVAHGLSCSTACGIFLDQGLNPCPLHQQADSYPLYHQGNLIGLFLKPFAQMKPTTLAINTATTNWRV